MTLYASNYLILPAQNCNIVKQPIKDKLQRRFYTETERKVLFQCIGKHRSKMVNKSHSAANNSRNLPWNDIAADFNASKGIRKATQMQLQNLYRNIKKKEDKKKRDLKNKMSLIKVEIDNDCANQDNQIQIADVVSADSSKQVSNDNNCADEVTSILGSDPISEDLGNSSTNSNFMDSLHLPSKSARPSCSKANLMKASSKAAEAFVELLNVAEPVTENNVLILKQKEEEHELRMANLAEEHNMKMMVLQAKLDYYRTLKEKVISLKDSKNET